MNMTLNSLNALRMKINLFPVLFMLLITSCGNNDEKSNGARSSAIPVDVYVLDEQAITETVNTTGNLKPWETATLRTRTAGEITRIYFEEGQPVKQNQKLVQLDDRPIKARLRKLKSELTTAQLERDRNAKLREVNGISQRELDQSENLVETLKADIEEQQVMLDFSTIKAPFDGTMGLRTVSPGDYLNVGESIGQMAVENTLRLRFNIPGKFASAVKTGDTVKFEIQGKDTIYTAVVFAREAQISATSRSMDVVAKVDNSAGNLIPGAFARVKIKVKAYDNAALVPSESVISNIKGQSVWVMKNGKAQNIEVNPGLRLSKSTQILSGLSKGDTVLTTGLLQVRENTPVIVKNIIKIEQN